MILAPPQNVHAKPVLTKFGLIDLCRLSRLWLTGHDPEHTSGNRVCQEEPADANFVTDTTDVDDKIKGF